MSERDVLKVDFFPEKIPFPKFTREEYLRQTAEEMLHLLTPKAEAPLLAPLAFGPPVLNAFAKVAEILRRATGPPAPPPATPISAPTKSPVLPLASTKVPAVTLPRVISPTIPLHVSPYHTRSTTRLSRQKLAQFVRHDPTVAGKMHDPETGRAETLDTLLQVPDSDIWTTSLTNE